MDYSDKQTDLEMARLEKKLNREYRKAWNELKEEAEKYFSQFEDRYQKEHEAYQEGKYTKEQFQNWYMSQVARGKQWEAKRDQMAWMMEHSNEIACQYINDATPSVFSLNANYLAYMTEKEYDVSFTLYNEEAVKSLLTDSRNNVEFRTVSINPKRDYKWNKEQIQSALASGIMQGKSIREIASSFLVVQERNKMAAIRNARTCMTSAQNAGRIDTMKRSQDMGIEVKKQWLAAKDSRTRDSHAILNGQIRDIDEAFDNGLQYPADSDGIPAEVYNCRCTLKYAYPRFQKLQSKELYSENKQGDETYQEWLKRKRNELDMATSVKRNGLWSATKSTTLSVAEKKELMQYAEKRGVIIRELQKFDGDPKLLKSGIDTVAKMQEKYPTQKCILAIAGFDDEKVFGETKGNTIIINNLALRNRKITEKILNGNEFASTRVEDIFTHEYGHLIHNEAEVDIFDTFKKAYYNIYKENISDAEALSYLKKNVSEYSTEYRKYKNRYDYWEIPSELLVKAEHDDILAIEYIRLTRGV